MLKFNKRLKAIIDNIPECCTIADIGTDHGKIVVGAIVENKAELAIASDISYESLNKAKELAVKYGVEDKISFRVGDGLKVIGAGDADTLIISGLGSREIINIIDASDILFSTYIFVPHQDAPDLRDYLSKSLYYISKDYIVESNCKFYNVIVCKKCKEMSKLDYKKLMLGQSSNQSKDYARFINCEYARLEKAISKIPKDNRKYNAKKKYLELVEKEINE